MSSYTIVSDVSNGIINLLRDHLAPDVVLSRDAIELCSPSDRNDASLSVFLYDIQENQEVRTSEMISEGINRQKYPSTYLSLYYMITAFSSSDLKYRSVEEYKIIGKTMQIMKDNSIMDKNTLQFKQNREEMDITIEMMKMDHNEKFKFFNMPNLSYKLSLFYKVTPIELESTKVKKITRVSNMDISLKSINQY